MCDEKYERCQQEEGDVDARECAVCAWEETGHVCVCVRVAGQREEVETWTRDVARGREGLYGDFVDLRAGQRERVHDVAVVAVVRANNDGGSF